MQQPAKSVSIGCTMLLGTDKKGVLKPDADGYYTVVLGAYGAYNSVNMFYDLASAQRFFQPGSPLMRMIEKGVLRGEYKHPERKVKDANGHERTLTDQEYLARIRSVDSDRVSHHIRRVYLVDGCKDEKGRPITQVVGEIRPSGPYGQVVKDALDNPHENVYFSVRSLTMDDVLRGIKYTQQIVTWDYVNEGGIYNANKYNSPALESFGEVQITPADLWMLAEEEKRLRASGMESSGVDYDSLIKDLGWGRQKVVKQPTYMNW